MYRRARRRTAHRPIRRIGLFAFLRRPLVQMAILGIAALVIVAILFFAKPR